MFRFVLFAASAVVILSVSIWAKVIQVPAQFASIQTAINVSVNGDTVLVAPGTYFENVKFRGRRIVVASRFLNDHQHGTIRTTIIDGSRPLFADSASVVLFNSGEDSSALLLGFTLTGGIGTLVPGSFLGGGILVTGGSAPRIMYNIVRNNSAILGGGIAVRYGFPTIAHNAIVANTSGQGAGLSLETGKMTITHNVFYENVADNRGGALSIRNSLVEFINNSVVGNRAREGGGINCEDGLWTIANCDFFLNAPGDFAGCGDTGLGDYGRDRNFNSDSADIYQNIHFDPRFANAAEYDFSLLCDSRLIDAGVTIPASHPLGGTREDIGMIEYPFRVGDLNFDNSVNVADVVKLINIIFSGAPIPCPPYVADADCDRAISIADAVAFINYWMGISETSCLFDLK